MKPAWEACTFKRRRPSTSSTTVRRLLSEFTLARSQAPELVDEVLQQAVIMAAGAAGGKKDLSAE
jgi:hypothetical protein